MFSALALSVGSASSAPPAPRLSSVLPHSPSVCRSFAALLLVVLPAGASILKVGVAKEKDPTGQADLARATFS